jgi:hypothetical protein
MGIAGRYVNGAETDETRKAHRSRRSWTTWRLFPIWEKIDNKEKAKILKRYIGLVPQPCKRSLHTMHVGPQVT